MESAGPLVLIAAAAFLLPLLAERMRVPAVVLEIVFGILVGPSLLGFIERSELLDLLADLGFFLLMFLSGFEIDFHRLGRQRAGPLLVALAIFGSTLALGYASALLLGFGVFMTFVLATTSVGLVVPTLRNTRREGTALGQSVLLAAILADFLTLLGVTIFALIHERGVGVELLGIPAFFVVIAGVLLALRRAAWWFPRRFERLFSQEDPDELGIRASLALMLIFVGLSALLGIEPILGAFLAGTIFALVFRHRGQLEQKLSGFSYGFLIPIFFISVGVRFDMAALTEGDVALRTGGLLLAAILVKLLPSLFLFLRGLSLREVLAAGTLISARLSLIIAVAELGLDLGLISRQVESAVILLALITTTLAPTLFRRLAPPLPAPGERPAPR